MGTVQAVHSWRGTAVRTMTAKPRQCILDRRANSLVGIEKAQKGEGESRVIGILCETCKVMDQAASG